MNGQPGRAMLEALIELVVALLIVPPLLCCAFQAVAMVIGIVLPWLALVAVVVVLGACLAVVLSNRPDRPLPDGRPLPPPLVVPPVRRPPGIPDRRRNH